MIPTDEITDPGWHDIFDRDKKIKEVSAQLDEIRAALMWGSDERFWPPGLTMGQSIARIIDRLDDAQKAIEAAPCEIACDGECTYECRSDRLCRVCKWRSNALSMLREHEAWRPDSSK